MNHFYPIKNAQKLFLWKNIFASTETLKSELNSGQPLCFEIAAVTKTNSF